ncbi:hypothetical protein R3P38DRAFT_2796110 [Favolaschia claudopus]|uniref:Uncharacterized protein n=1 Tax=Favolaschia claudopus TaxID=2862362 RepID=A0AAW0A4W3_9AGAR
MNVSVSLCMILPDFVHPARKIPKQPIVFANRILTSLSLLSLPITSETINSYLQAVRIRVSTLRSSNSASNSEDRHCYENGDCTKIQEVVARGDLKRGERGTVEWPDGRLLRRFGNQNETLIDAYNRQRQNVLLLQLSLANPHRTRTFVAAAFFKIGVFPQIGKCWGPVQALGTVSESDGMRPDVAVISGLRRWSELRIFVFLE